MSPPPSAVLAVIPARLASTRLPRKVLADLGGRPLVAWAHDRACAASRVGRVVIATDSPEVASACGRFGAHAVLTRSDHACGTERCAEVARRLEAELVLVVQADEPLLPPGLLDELVGLFADPGVEAASVLAPLEEAERADPSVVKVVVDEVGDALGFSRTVIPGGANHKHVGVYAWRRAALLRFVALPPSESERTERLEQLRWLDSGGRMRMLRSEHGGIGVDTWADLQRVRALVEGGA